MTLEKVSSRRRAPSFLSAHTHKMKEERGFAGASLAIAFLPKRCLGLETAAFGEFILDEASPAALDVAGLGEGVARCLHSWNLTGRRQREAGGTCVLKQRSQSLTKALGELQDDRNSD